MLVYKISVADVTGSDRQYGVNAGISVVSRVIKNPNTLRNRISVPITIPQSKVGGMFSERFIDVLDIMNATCWRIADGEMLRQFATSGKTFIFSFLISISKPNFLFSFMFSYSTESFQVRLWNLFDCNFATLARTCSNDQYR